jgi:hypothetical protein
MTITDNPNLLRAQRALAGLRSNPDFASRYANELSEYDELLTAASRTPKPEELSDAQLDRIELFVEGLRNEVLARKRQAELEVRSWELYEHEFDEIFEAIEEKRRRSVESLKDRSSDDG